MARRRRKSAGPAKPLLLLALLGALGYVAWRYGPDAWRTFVASNPPSQQTPPGAARPLDVCALVEDRALADALRAAKLEARHVGAASDVPAAGACTWTFEHAGREASVVALVFTRASLARSKQPALFGAQYYKSTVAGLEYAYKELPVALTGIGDEAAAAGFAASAPEAQIVARRGDAVLDLVVKGVDRGSAERAAALIVARI